MSIDDLLSPVSPDNPVGAECVYKPKFREAVLLNEFLVARAELEEFRRRERLVFTGENASSDQAFARSELAAAEDRFKNTTARARDVLGKAPSVTDAAEAVEQRCLDLLNTTGKDLAVVQQWAIAALQLRGIPGLKEAAELFDGLLKSFAGTVHPPPEESDPSDESARAMLLGEVVNGTGFLALLRETVVVASGPGRMSFRDAEVLDDVIDADTGSGSLSGPEHLRAIVQADASRARGIALELIDDTALKEHLQQLLAPLLAAEELLRNLVNRFPGLISGERVLVLLHRATRHLGLLQDEAGAASASAAVSAAMGLDHDPSQLVSASGAAVMLAGGRRLATRDDARRMILEIAVFLEKSEPAHPAPMFLRRAERLLGATSFFDIVRDMLSSSAMDDVAHVTGQKVPDAPSQN